MIFLHKSDLLGEGTARLVYQHPDDGRKCIKVVTHQKLLLKKKHRGIRGFLLPLSYFDPTRFETHFFQKLDARRDDEIFRYLPRCYGSVSTNLGSGMTFDRVGYQNLESYLTNNPFDPTMEKNSWNYVTFSSEKRFTFLIGEPRTLSFRRIMRNLPIKFLW